MNKKDCKRIITIFVLIIFILNVVLFMNAKSKAIECKYASKVIPFYFHASPNYWSDISDIVSCDGYLYVMFESKNVLAVYSLNGEYLHSYSFNMSKNGRSKLQTSDTFMYLESREHNLYAFKEGMFSHYLDSNTEEYLQIQEEIFKGSNTNQLTKSVEYRLHGASVLREDEHGSEVVIFRPAWLAIYQGSIQWVIHMFCILYFIILKFSKHTYN